MVRSHRTRPFARSLLLLLTIVVACGDGDGPTGVEEAPVLRLSTVEARFEAVEGGEDPEPAVVELANDGGGTIAALQTSIAYGDGEPAGWLTAALDRSSAPSTLTLSASIDALAPGEYTASVTIGCGVATTCPRTVAVGLQVQPAPIADLVAVGKITVLPTTAAPGGTVTVSGSLLRNAGTIASDAFEIGYYLSADSTITTDDTRLGGASVEPLSVGVDVEVGEQALEIPAATELGPYFLGVLVDEEDGVPEGDEGNNYVSTRLTITDPRSLPLIELSETAIEFEATIGLPTQMQLVVITNAGGGELGDLKRSIEYGDGQPEGWLNAFFVTLVDGKGTRAIYIQPLIGELSVGTYSATVSVTATAAANSPATLDITLTVHDFPMPDLTVVPPLTVTPTTVEPGGTVTLSSWTILNQGTQGVAGVANGIYLSTDSTITADDTFFGGNVNSSIAGGQSVEWGAVDLTIPAATPPGTYYIGVLVDRENGAPESDETNNYLSARLTVVAPEASTSTLTDAASPTRGPRARHPGSRRRHSAARDHRRARDPARP